MNNSDLPNNNIIMQNSDWIERFPFLEFNGTMSEDEVLNLVKMRKAIKNAQKQHPYKIHHTDKSGWFTNVDDPSCPNGKRKIRKCSEEKLMIALAEHYSESNQKKVTLPEVHNEWIEHKKTPTNASTIRRIEKSWEAYYLNEPLSQELLNKPLANITVMELRTWAEQLLKKHYPVDQKKFSRIFGIIKGCYEYASDEDVNIVSEDLWSKAQKKLPKKLRTEKATPFDEEQVFTDKERLAIRQMVYDDLKRYPTSAGLQILFLFETGLRIGEVCGLKWTDIKDSRLYIQRQADNYSVREWTKTEHGRRDIPLTTTAKQILEDVKAFNQKHGYMAEWIFQSDNPDFEYRLGYQAADQKLRKLCKRLHTTVKSPHKIRKTCISTLLDDPNVNDRTVQRFAGHSDISTTYRFYNFERKSKEEQALAIEKALAL